LYHANITHNLNSMAEEAGIYGITWRPEENGIERAAQLIEPLADGIARMKSDPDRFRRFNPENGWGSYDAFIPWLESYLSACREHPDALVTASR